MFSRGRGGVVVRLLASHQGEPGSIPGEVALGFSHVGIVPDDGRCRWSASFLGDLLFPPPSHSGAALYSPSFTLICSQDPDHKLLSPTEDGREWAGEVTSLQSSLHHLPPLPCTLFLSTPDCKLGFLRLSILFFGTKARLRQITSCMQIGRTLPITTSHPNLPSLPCTPRPQSRSDSTMLATMHPSSSSYVCKILEVIHPSAHGCHFSKVRQNRGDWIQGCKWLPSPLLAMSLSSGKCTEALAQETNHLVRANSGVCRANHLLGSNSCRDSIVIHVQTRVKDSSLEGDGTPFSACVTSTKSLIMITLFGVLQTPSLNCVAAYCIVLYCIEKFWSALCGQILSAARVRVKWGEDRATEDFKGEGNSRTLRKHAIQRQHPPRFPHAKIQMTSTGIVPGSRWRVAWLLTPTRPPVEQTKKNGHGEPWKTEIRRAGPRIEPGSSRLRVQYVTTARHLSVATRRVEYQPITALTLATSVKNVARATDIGIYAHRRRRGIRIITFVYFITTTASTSSRLATGTALGGRSRDVTKAHARSLRRRKAPGHLRNNVPRVYNEALTPSRAIVSGSRDVGHAFLLWQPTKQRVVDAIAGMAPSLPADLTCSPGRGACKGRVAAQPYKRVYNTGEKMGRIHAKPRKDPSYIALFPGLRSRSEEEIRAALPRASDEPSPLSASLSTGASAIVAQRLPMEPSTVTLLLWWRVCRKVQCRELESSGMNGAGEIEDPRENQRASGIVRHDSHMQISGSDSTGDQTQVRRRKGGGVNQPGHIDRRQLSAAGEGWLNGWLAQGKGRGSGKSP
ncbi:hypothetical protein PR048_006475 [Dryococelus australis]|uniref:Uncharacterized protein n=1 Tax=Dryococelus australis TaxID=614101 RepID=A0ABQ9ICA0_9NEOP|nr:hypothetical protein PR048_006475 [Dryococelus australis]